MVSSQAVMNHYTQGLNEWISSNSGSIFRTTANCPSDSNRAPQLSSSTHTPVAREYTRETWQLSPLARDFLIASKQLRVHGMSLPSHHISMGVVVLLGSHFYSPIWHNVLPLMGCTRWYNIFSFYLAITDVFLKSYCLLSLHIIFTLSSLFIMEVEGYQMCVRFPVCFEVQTLYPTCYQCQAF